MALDAKMLLMNGAANATGSAHNSSSTSSLDTLRDNSSLSSSGILDLGSGTPAKGLTAHVRYASRLTNIGNSGSSSNATASDYAQVRIEAANSKSSSSSWTSVLQFDRRIGGTSSSSASTDNSSQSSTDETKRFVTNKRYIRAAVDFFLKSAGSSSSDQLSLGKVYLAIGDEGFDNI